MTAFKNQLITWTINKVVDDIFSSEETDEEDNIKIKILQKNEKEYKQRLENYVEVIISQYSANDFKSHFR